MSKLLERKLKSATAKGFIKFGKIKLPIQTATTPFIPQLLPYKEHSKVLETTAFALASDIPLLLIGETGVGKTAAIRHIAAVTRNSLRRVNVNGSMTAEDFVGQLLVNKEGTYWKDGVLTEAMRNGYWIVIDEINAASAEILFVLHSLLDDDRYIVLTEHPEREIVRAHPNFRIIATMNPPDRYAGTKELNKALLSRFSITLEVPLPPSEVEMKAIAHSDKFMPKEEVEKLKNFLAEMRSAYDKEEVETFISPRDTRSIVNMLGFTGSIHKALELTIMPRSNKEEQKAIKSMARLHFATANAPKEEAPTPAHDLGAKQIQIGDTVAMLPTSRYQNEPSNPHFMFGIVDSISPQGDVGVKWDNGHHNGGYKEGRDIVNCTNAKVGDKITFIDSLGHVRKGDTGIIKKIVSVAPTYQESQYEIEFTSIALLHTMLPVQPSGGSLPKSTVKGKYFVVS